MTNPKSRSTMRRLKHQESGDKVETRTKFEIARDDYLEGLESKDLQNRFKNVEKIANGEINAAMYLGYGQGFKYGSEWAYKYARAEAEGLVEALKKLPCIGNCINSGDRDLDSCYKCSVVKKYEGNK